MEPERGTQPLAGPAEPLPPDVPTLVARAAASGGPCVVFDGNPESARVGGAPELRRFAYVLAAPSAGLLTRGDRAWRWDVDGGWSVQSGEPWSLLRGLLRAATRRPDVPFPHGVAGLMTYDAARRLEALPALAADDTHLPDIVAFRFDAVAQVDTAASLVTIHTAAGASESGERLAALLRRRERARAPPRLAPPMPGMTRAAFARMVHAAKARVRDGDIFQANLSQRFVARGACDPVGLYLALRQANPAPFSCYFDPGPLPPDADLRRFRVLSSSPERLFRIEDRRLEARPIAGTRPRGATPDEDAKLIDDLRGDPKERAEHVMLVDLARNDLGRVAEYASVQVPLLLSVESYQTVHHLVSVVEARLARDKDAVDALIALFPGGTITGAPKVRAMEVIESLEPVRRGAYTGSLGWIADSGDADWNILIRTLTHFDDEVHLQVGAGIVDESDADREYEETLAKAEALFAALRGGGR